MLEVRPKQKQRRASRFKSFRRKWSLYVLYLAAAGLLVAGGVAVYVSHPIANTGDQQLIAVGQGFVRSAIREELKTNFSGVEETRVEPLPGHKFLIAGWVDVISKSGETERQDFSCVIFKNESDSWAGEKISVIPQRL